MLRRVVVLLAMLSLRCLWAVEASNSANLDSVVASVIWAGLPDRSASVVAGLVEGMYLRSRSNSQEKHSLPGSKLLADYAHAQFLVTAENNFEASDRYFSDLALDVNLHEVVPGKIYIRSLASGSGPILDQHCSQLEMHLRVEAVTGTVRPNYPYKDTFVANSPDTYRVEELLPSVILALEGMRCGETREIYLHSDVAYGSDSHFEPGSSLRCVVELVSLQKTGATPIPKPSIVVQPRPEHIAETELEILGHKIGMAMGYACWDHFMLASDRICIDQVVNAIKSLASAGDIIDIDELDLALFRKLETDLYLARSSVSPQLENADKFFSRLNIASRSCSP